MFRVLLLATAASFVMGHAAPLTPKPIPLIGLPNIPIPHIHVDSSVVPTVSNNVLPTLRRHRRSPAERVLQANQRALHEPTVDNFMDAVQVYPFAQSALYRLFAAPQQVSDIALEPGETLSAISAGDTVRWAVGDTSSGSGSAKQVHVMVKPFAPCLKTNLVILTDRRSYHLVLQSTEHVAMASVSWSYPAAGLIAEKTGESVPASAPATEAGIKPENLNFQYAIDGDSPTWKPVRAFDDGQKVYIEFPSVLAKVESPPLFVVDVDGAAQLVNYRVAGRYYIVDQLFEKAELRLGADKQQVVRITRQSIEPHRNFFGG
jgi:type IV secretion system protein TrbG